MLSFSTPLKQDGCREDAHQTLRNAPENQPKSWDLYHRLKVDIALPTLITADHGLFDQRIKSSIGINHDFDRLVLPPKRQPWGHTLALRLSSQF